jgi:hypothetical protein
VAGGQGGYAHAIDEAFHTMLYLVALPSGHTVGVQQFAEVLRPTDNSSDRGAVLALVLVEPMSCAGRADALGQPETRLTHPVVA